MKCSSVRSLIDSYLDGTCDEKKSRSVEEHTASCKDCAEELAYAKRVRDKMRSLSAIKAPAGFEEKIFRLTGTSAPSVGMKIIRFLNQKTVLIPLGSAAVIIMGLSIFLITDFRTGDKSTGKIVASNTETYDSKQAKGKISNKKETIDTFAAKAPLESTSASKPSGVKREKEMKPAGGYVETEVQLAYNSSAGLVKEDIPVPAVEASSSEESVRDADSFGSKKRALSPSAVKEKSGRSEARRDLEQQDDFAARIDRTILSSGGTRVRLNGKSPVKASTGGNNATARDTYTAKVIVPEEDYDALIKRLSDLGTLSAPAVRPAAEKGYIEFILTVRRGN